jgi:hypothetical protein
MLNFDNKLNKEKIADKTFAFSRYLDDYFGLLILIVILAIVLTSFFLLWYPRYIETVDRVYKAKEAVSDEINSLMRYKGQLASYKEAYLSISDLDKERINDVIGPASKYDTVYISDLLINYHKLLDSNGYVLDSMEIEQVATVKPKTTSKKKQEVKEEDVLPEGIAKMVVTLSVKSMDYEKLRSLLGLLETELRIADVRSISCESGIASCEIGFDTYFLLSEKSKEAEKVKK